MTTRLSADAARRIALAAQGFTRPRPSGRVTRQHLRRVFDDIGLIQVDSVNVLVRSQELPLFARLGAHPRTLIPDAVAAGELFEYWAHVASIVPTKHLPLFRWRMAAMVDGRYARHFTQRRPGMLEKVLDQVRDRGPLAVGDVEGRVRNPGHVVELGRRQAGPGDPLRPGRRQRHPAPERLRPAVRPHRAHRPRRGSRRCHRSRSPRLGGSCCCSPPARSASPRSRISATTTDSTRRRSSRSSQSWWPTARWSPSRSTDGTSRRSSIPTAAAPRRVTGRALLVAVRLADLVPRAHRAPVRLQLPDRDLHAEAEADLRLLRAAVPARRPTRRARRPQGRPWRRGPAGPGHAGSRTISTTRSTARQSPSSSPPSSPRWPAGSGLDGGVVAAARGNLAKDLLGAPNVMPIVESDA